jgi:hypothetical protein
MPASFLTALRRSSGPSPSASSNAISFSVAMAGGSVSMMLDEE